MGRTPGCACRSRPERSRLGHQELEMQYCPSSPKCAAKMSPAPLEVRGLANARHRYVPYRTRGRPPRPIGSARQKVIRLGLVTRDRRRRCKRPLRGPGAGLHWALTRPAALLTTAAKTASPRTFFDGCLVRAPCLAIHLACGDDYCRCRHNPDTCPRSASGSLHLPGTAARSRCGASPYAQRPVP